MLRAGKASPSPGEKQPRDANARPGPQPEALASLVLAHGTQGGPSPLLGGRIRKGGDGYHPSNCLRGLSSDPHHIPAICLLSFCLLPPPHCARGPDQVPRGQPQGPALCGCGRGHCREGLWFPPDLKQGRSGTALWRADPGGREPRPAQDWPEPGPSWRCRPQQQDPSACAATGTLERDISGETNPEKG